MDKSLKNDYIQAYLDRQKVYVHSYSSEGIHPPSKISNRTPTRTPTRTRYEETKKLEFGFDTPILVPRVTRPDIVSTDKRSVVVGLPAKATQKARKTQQALDAETSIKENKGSVHAPIITAQRDTSKRKRKKAEVPVSDEEHEARLSERRERKRVKRDIVKPDSNIQVHDSPPASEREHKKVARKRAKKNLGTAGLALLHGFSATNVGKNRLTLKPLASLGVFNKGKSSAKTKVYKTKEPAQKLFSEIAFLNKTTKKYESLVDESLVPDSSSRPPSAMQRIKITNHDKDEKSTRSASDHATTLDLPREGTAISEPWDIEFQSQCPSSDGFRPQPGEPIAGTLVPHPRMASWHDQELPSDVQVMHSSLISPTRETFHDCTPDKILSSVSASVIATIYDLDGEPSIHPSHSASQVGLKRLDDPKPSVELLTSKYFAVHDDHDAEHVSPSFDERRPIAKSSSVISGCNLRDAHPLYVSHPHDTSTTHRAAPLNAMVDSSPLRIHGIPEDHFLPLADDLMPTYRGHSIMQYSRHNEDVISAWYALDACTTSFSEGDSGHHNLQDQDLVFLEPPYPFNEPSFYPPVHAYSSDGLHDIPGDDIVVLDEPCQGPRKLVEYTQEVDDYEQSDFALELSSLHHGTFSSPTRSNATAEAYDNDSCRLRPFLQGRAMLLGIPPYVPPWHDYEHTEFGNGLLSAEVDVAKRLKDHWRPHRL
ncbi:uncharacterized protein EDB93DRAFT_795618 [Suillus bovinus]|uniref:uncharacterized protein n=1 Tax=Suillus bovinus TaxID=48563 RepID=UPI001B885F4A|nr:uncharacterized protein EDB93DRAFT_795618 [Suillus bovinus]KAG2135906.1 hypothetical protein EDB93DRAFT_795618 [Suillus bovinus]